MFAPRNSSPIPLYSNEDIAAYQVWMVSIDFGERKRLFGVAVADLQVDDDRDDRARHFQGRFFVECGTR